MYAVCGPLFRRCRNKSLRLRGTCACGYVLSLGEVGEVGQAGVCVFGWVQAGVHYASIVRVGCVLVFNWRLRTRTRGCVRAHIYACACAWAGVCPHAVGA